MEENSTLKLIFKGTVLGLDITEWGDTRWTVTSVYHVDVLIFDSDVLPLNIMLLMHHTSDLVLRLGVFVFSLFLRPEGK